MKTIFPGLLLWLFLVPAARMRAAEAEVPEDYSCNLCHAKEGELWNEQTPVVEAKDLVGDIHWQKGLLCHDCHGGSATMEEFKNHREDETFRATLKPTDIPAFCGYCHANAEYMKKFDPASPIDLVERFAKSAHGQSLKKAADRLAAAEQAAANSPAPDGETPGNEEDPADVERPAGAPEEPGAEPGAAPGDAGPPVDGEPAKLPPDIARQLVNCGSCHPHHKMRSASDPQSLTHASHLAAACGECHAPQHDLLRTDAHSKAGPKDSQGVGTVLSCHECHGQDVHGMLPVSDHHSPVFVNNQVEGCGRCHEKDKQSYLASVHGRGLTAAGLLQTAVCASCHGAHGILPAKNEKSLLHVTQVAATCGTCHRFIEQRLKTSVHGGESGPGGTASRPAPGGDIRRTASCTDCHQKHDAVEPGTTGFRSAMANRCGDCHAKLSQQYTLSVHGELTNLGYGPAAKCADCHGAHEIQKKSDPRSLVSSVNLGATCSKCHPGATANFLQFRPHADHHDPTGPNKIVHAVYLVLMTFLIGTFGVFGVHSILWFVRGIIDVWTHGRPKIPAPGDVAYVRFRPGHRAAHALLFTSFLGLALTGLPLKYSHIPWAQWLAELLGGFESTSTWHRIFGLVNVLCLVAYIIRLGYHLVTAAVKPATFNHVVFGPESPVPTMRDFKDFLKMIRWFVGLGPRPTFERWAYWEKFDFWGAAADIVIIGSTGLILWFPVWFCQYLPGEAVNISKVIHSTQALLATGFVFAIHFYSVFIRPEKFPMDMAMLTGMVSEEELKHERPEYYERLRREGRLEERRTVIPSRRATLLVTLGGYLAFAIGTALLVGIVVAALAG